MSNGKSGRKNLVKTVLGIIILVIASLLGVDVFPQETLEQRQPVEGELQVHMIDVGQADCFLLVQGNQTALVDCGTRSTGENAIA